MAYDKSNWNTGDIITSDKLNNIENGLDDLYTLGVQKNIQSDWNQTDSTKDDYIKNKPVIGNTTPYTLPTASTTTLGGVKIDNSSITINENGVINANVSDSIIDTKVNTYMEAHPVGATVADKSVTPEKTTFITYVQGITDYIEGYVEKKKLNTAPVVGSPLDIIDDKSQYAMTNPIEITEGEGYLFPFAKNALQYIVFLDSDNNYLASNYVRCSTYFLTIAPVGAKKLQIFYRTDCIVSSNMHIYKYEDFLAVKGDIVKKTYSLDSAVVGNQLGCFTRESFNLFDPALSVVGAYLAITNGVQQWASGVGVTSPLIKIDHDTVYYLQTTASALYRCYVYTYDKYLGNIKLHEPTNYYRFDEDEYYVIVSSANTIHTIDNLFFGKTCGPVEPVDFRSTIATPVVPSTFDTYLRDRGCRQGLAGLKWLAIGDSITFYSNYSVPLAKERHMMLCPLCKIGWNVNDALLGLEARTAGLQDSVVFDKYDHDIVTLAIGTNNRRKSAQETVNMGTIDDPPERGLDQSFCSQFKYLLVRVAELYPHMRFGVITPYGVNDVDEIIADEVAICKMYGVPCLNMKENFPMAFKNLVSSDYTSAVDLFIADGLHPNVNGGAIMARRIGAFMETL